MYHWYLILLCDIGRFSWSLLYTDAYVHALFDFRKKLNDPKGFPAPRIVVGILARHSLSRGRVAARNSLQYWYLSIKEVVDSARQLWRRMIKWPGFAMNEQQASSKRGKNNENTGKTRWSFIAVRTRNEWVIRGASRDFDNSHKSLEDTQGRIIIKRICWYEPT